MCRTERLNIVAGLGLVCAALGTISCSSRTESPVTTVSSAAAPATRTFSAVLFPYIPDAGNDSFASLIESLESRFQQAHPEIDLEITMDPSMNLYDMDTLETLLGTGQDSYNMVEVDMLLLGDLVAQQLVQPLPFEVSDLEFFRAARVATQIRSEPYGVPTYLCGNHVYSWDAGIHQVDSGDDLIKFLRESPDPNATALVGNFKGSWTLPAFYVDDWADTHTNHPSQVAKSYDLPLNRETMSSFSPVVNLCGPKGGPCLDGTYKDNTKAETLFAQRKANGFVGYSERLFYILQARVEYEDSSQPSVISAPLGEHSHPMVFVDALVLNPSCLDECAADANKFSRFMSSLEVRNLIAFSQDVAGETFPRYLLQALETFYTSPPASQNAVYQQLVPFLQEAEAFPNQRFPQAREPLNTALEEVLTESETPAEESPANQQ